ncbi:hypothetical protein QRX25_10340 [Bacillus sp. L381]|uniref:hypothetical protein n=1 Tax=Bacillus TaxID=1386 RepID=UPI001BA4D868|nr:MULTISPECIES: hypothetical protein [Bacillus]MCR9040964.1 hypothetical protein [Bacillus velezensis]MEC3841580.1 hypothetical protein [Bacillus amyloliquefaciens]QUN07954.1 hypothetical protein KEF49_10195 [Bacillus amyloliquefaciens]QYM81020.1 hypothetical protein KTJ85_10045 [Bacillus sp. 7D3]QZY10167.1 hypothetical protein K7B13_10270 [Bacillus amyloliquefaciens]
MVDRKKGGKSEPGKDGEDFAMEHIVQDHEKRIIALEKGQEELKNGMLKIENTVLSEGREQRSMLNKMIQYSFEDKQHKRDNNVKLKQLKWTTISGVVSSGGILYLIVERIFG